VGEGAGGQERPRGADGRSLAVQARRLLRDSSTSPVELLALARRAGEEGDGRTLLELVDGILERDPDHRATLAWLATQRDRIQLELPLPPVPEVWEVRGEALDAAVDGVFAVAGSWPPAAAELAVLRLEDAAHPDGVRAAARRRLVDPRPGVRAFAALVLRRAFPGAEADALIERSLLDPATAVRKQAALGLAAVADPAVAAPAVRALTARAPVLRLHGAEALGWMGHPEAVPPLADALLSPPTPSAAGGSIAGAPRAYAFFGTQTAYVQDFDVEVATNAGIADPTIGVLGSGAVLDVRVIGASSSTAAVQRAARASLVRLTGEDPGKNERAWRDWWATTEHNPENATAPAGEPDPETR
jgi:HEAT repeat protein